MRLFFDPHSVVLIGVSRKSGPGAYNNLEMMLRYGYQGRIDLVHPKVSEILGRKAYPRVSDLPEAPDLAVISVGRDRVLPAFAECVEKGISRVIIISQGFADADDHGKELQKQLIELAQNHGTRVVGPNTMGVLNAFSGFSTAFIDLERDPSPPALTLIAQSGVFQVGFESFTGRLGKAIDIGNASDVDFVDVLEFLENDTQTRIIVLHMEGIRRGRDFLTAAERISRTKPIIVLKTGRSEAGARAALSHTGSLVGEDTLFDLAFAQAGLIRVRNMIELRAVCNAFLHFGSMSGPRLGVATATGACGIMTADACEDYGLELAPFPEQIRSQIEDPHISWHRLHNPVDLWPLGMVSGSFTDVFQRSVTGLLNDDRVDAVLGIAPALLSPLHRDLDISAVIQELTRTNRKHKPIALWLYGGGETRQADALKHESDVACFSSLDEAVMGLSAVWRYQRSLIKRKQVREEGAFTPPARPVLPAAPLPADGLILGERAFALLSEYGIPVVPGEIARDLHSAGIIAAELGYPVVLKIISPQWLHKSDWGGIRLNVGSEAELMRSFKDLEALFLDKTPAGSLEGILVQKQAQGRELLLGIKRDPQFGPVLVVGTGGIYTEILKDVARQLAPITRSDAGAMIESLRAYPILRGIRGRKSINLDAVRDALLGLSRLASDHPEIRELDLNPVMADVAGCLCVDCRIVLG